MTGEIKPDQTTSTATNDNKPDAEQSPSSIQPAPSSIQAPQQKQQQPPPNPDTGSSSSTGTPPRRPRPVRPNLRRQVVVAASPLAMNEHQVMGPAQIELAGVLQPAGRATMVPPKRPTRLPPARLYHHHHHPHHHRQQTSLGATVSTGAPKPNRYSWAQMQQWQAAAAAAAAATGEQAPGDQEGQAGGGTGGFHYHLPSPFGSAASRVLYVNPTLVNLSEHTKSRLIKFIEAIKKFSEKWFSHVLLLMFLAVYACFGAYVFISFEAPTEQWEKQLIIDTRQRIVNDSYDVAHSKSREDYFELFRMQFEEYERLLNRVCASGMSSSSLENQWTFWGGLFYSMTVFTTIGYGHLTPITFAGRVATMVYAIFGIPILLMVLADLGKLLTRIIKYAFKQFNYLYNKLLRRKASVRTRKLISDNTNQYIGVAKDAFERGFAYIQPYQQRIHPAAFLSSYGGQFGLSGRPKQPERPQAADSSQQMESSEVIVTPNKQTKPVSPQPGQNSGKKVPLISTKHDTDHQSHTTTTTNNNHHHHQQHSRHGRAQSPAVQSKSRKISTSNRQDNQHNSSSSKKSKPAVSRSSSTSNVAQNAGQSTSHKKRTSADHSVAGEQQQQVEQTFKPDAKAAEEARVSPENSNDQKADNQQDIQEDNQPSLEYQEDQQDLEEEDEEDFDIPVSFALFLLITYMMFGAAVFSIWEGWNFFDALYFVFISMSTIGFGDLVPQHPKVMVGTFAYLLFGLALTSMCINVVQEKIHATFLRAKMQIGEKMGFDLDQIMADDYYDGGSAFEDDDDFHSVAAVSQTNSSQGVQSTSCTGDQNGPANEVEPDSRHAKKATVSLDALSAAEPMGGQKSPKTKESSRWRKRNDPLGGSLKRKLSNKKQLQPPRQTTPSSPTGQQTKQAQKSAPETTIANKSLELQPIKSQLEVIRTTHAGVVPGLEQNRGPGINQPIAKGAKAFCEPLRRPTSDANRSNSPVRLASSNTNSRPMLTATRSQPNSLAKSLDSSSPNQNHSRTHLNANNRHHHSVKVKGRSLSGSRRASVSDELNQLDDLIVSLSRTPSERFGPLLGIPATSGRNMSRSVSPSASVSTLGGRRGTSMTSRQSSAANSPRPVIQKKRSLASQLPAPNQLSPGGRSDFSLSGARAPLNLSESQAALDELEAVRFSAV